MKTISKTIVQDFAEPYIGLTYNEMYCVKGGQGQTTQQGSPQALPNRTQQPGHPPEPPGGGGRPTQFDTATIEALLDAVRQIYSFAGF